MDNQCWAADEIIRLPSRSGGFRVWRVVGVFIGGVNQESVVELETLDRTKNTEGRMCVPEEMLVALMKLTDVKRFVENEYSQLMDSVGGPSVVGGDLSEQTDDTERQQESVVHTPGPWEVLRTNRNEPLIVTSEDRLEVCHLSHGTLFRDIDANARLIAAAPQLLAACQNAMAACRENLAKYAYKDEPALLAAFKDCESAVEAAALVE